MDSIFKHVSHLAAHILAPVRDPFARDTAGLPEATVTEIVELRDGEVFELRAGPVRKRIGETIVKMLAIAEHLESGMMLSFRVDD